MWAKTIFPHRIIILILSLAFVVRVLNLESNPPELFSDEITHVLSARNIIETGRDINGKLNLYLYNRLKLGAPIYGYLAALSTYTFGNNTFAIRFPAVLAGTFSVFLIYQLCLLVVKDKVVSLMAGFVAALTPWNIYFSRIAWEPSLILPFILSGVLAFYKSVNSGRIQRTVLPYIIFSVAVYAADALEFLAPIFLLILILINIKDVWKNRRSHLFGICIASIVLIPYVIVVVNNPLKYQRSEKISTFAKGVNEQSVKVFAKNYISHLSPNFLFINGDSNLRHGTGGDGVLYWTLLPFILLGFLYSIFKIRKKSYLFILTWLLIFPLGGSLTNDGVPHATRTLIGSPVFTILFAVGVFFILSQIKRVSYRAIFVAFVSFTIVLEFAIFANNYFIKYPTNSQPWWDYGERKIFLSIKNNTTGSESLCLPNVQYWHEDTYPNYYLGVGNQYKMIFDLNNPTCLSSDILALPTERDAPIAYKKVETIYNLQGEPIWIIYKSTTLKTE